MSADTLTIVVPIVGSYASANAVSDHGGRGGRKSAAYLTLFRAVREAARAEMERVGWTPATYRCRVEIVRYVDTLAERDAGNVGKVEEDALEPSDAHEERRDRCAPFPGVWANDHLARPVQTDIEYDPAGPDRVVIFVRRRFPDPLAIAQAAAAPQSPRRRAAAPAADNTPAGSKRSQTLKETPKRPIPGDGPPALLNGQPVDRDEALRYIASGRTGALPPRSARRR